MLKRIAVLVSGGGTNLQALIDAQKSGIIKSGEIALVISSNPHAYALERAKKAGIKALVFDKKALGADFEREICGAIEQHGIDLIVLAGFMCILSDEFVGKFDRRIINVHPSLIPSFCGEGFFGLRVHEAALAYGVKISGATVHFVNCVVDGGEIIMQKAVEVSPADTPQTLQKRIMEQAEQVILPLAVEQVLEQNM